MGRSAGWAGLGAVVAAVLIGCAGSPVTPTGSSASSNATTNSVAATTATSVPSGVALYDAACAGKLTNHTLGAVKPGDITEISGVVVSRANPGVLWVHNDSGGKPEAYALSTTGDLLGTFPLAGATAIDWEDIAMGPGPVAGTDYLYLGDIGDNAVGRPNVTIYRMAEPKVGSPNASDTSPPGPVETFTITYPDGPHNAETLMVDPSTGELVIITKENDGPSHIFTAPASALTNGAQITMRKSGELERGSSAASGPLSLVTGGDISRDGSVVAVRSYGGVSLYRRVAGQTISQALSAPPCDGNAAIEVQGEAIGFAPDGMSYYTLSEGTNVAIDQDTVG